MNRKEIIVFSVFVNTGLLITLFIFALRPTLKGEMNIESQEVVIVNEKKTTPEKKSTELDQVDEILKEYIAKAELVVEEKTPVKQIETIKKQPPLKKKKENNALLEVIVKQGDVLEKIARRYHTTVEEIMHINKMKDTRLRIGQILFVKENTKKRTPISTVNKSPKKKIEQKYYTVKNGDSPWTIAIKNHIKVADLLRLNSLNEAKAKKIKPGDKLRIR